VNPKIFELLVASIYVTLPQVNPATAEQILLNEIQDIKNYDERTLLKATRIWLANKKS
jgi:hypothetical protein